MKAMGWFIWRALAWVVTVLAVVVFFGEPALMLLLLLAPIDLWPASRYRLLIGLVVAWVVTVLAVVVFFGEPALMLLLLLAPIDLWPAGHYQPEHQHPLVVVRTTRARLRKIPQSR